MNLLTISFQFGQRPENMTSLLVGKGHFCKDESGEEVLEVAFPRMKNHPCKMSTANMPVFKQRILRHSNAKLCGIMACGAQLPARESAIPWFAPLAKDNARERGNVFDGKRGG